MQESFLVWSRSGAVIYNEEMINPDRNLRRALFVLHSQQFCGCSNRFCIKIKMLTSPHPIVSCVPSTVDANGGVISVLSQP